MAASSRENGGLEICGFSDCNPLDRRARSTTTNRVKMLRYSTTVVHVRPFCLPPFPPSAAMATSAALAHPPPCPTGLAVSATTALASTTAMRMSCITGTCADKLRGVQLRQRLQRLQL